MKKIILIILFTVLSINAAYPEYISGSNYAEKIQRNIDKLQPDQKIKVSNVCKGNNKVKNVWIYSDKYDKTIDLYVKCRIVGGNYHDYFKRKSDQLANNFCSSINAVAIPRGKARHEKGLGKGLGDLLSGNLQVIGNSYVCKTLPVNTGTTGNDEASKNKSIASSSDGVNKSNKENGSTTFGIIVGSIIFLLLIYFLFIKSEKVPNTKKPSSATNKYAAQSAPSIKKKK